MPGRWALIALGCWSCWAAVLAPGSVLSQGRSLCCPSLPPQPPEPFPHTERDVLGEESSPKVQGMPKGPKTFTGGEQQQRGLKNDSEGCGCCQKGTASQGRAARATYSSGAGHSLGRAQPSCQLPQCHSQQAWDSVTPTGEIENKIKICGIKERIRD